MEIYIYYILSGVYILFTIIVLLISLKKRINLYLLAPICLLLTPIIGLIFSLNSSNKGLITHYKIEPLNSESESEKDSDLPLMIHNKYFA